MNEFLFNCPTCGQHVLAKAKWVGRRMTCSSCETRFTISTPGSKPANIELAAPLQAAGKPKPPVVRMKIKLPAKPGQTAPAPASIPARRKRKQ